MRELCGILDCGEPAVDFLERVNEDGETVRLYLCSRHWDHEVGDLPK